ncbi:arylsulfatase [Cellulophaga sp. L1A9]|uniref:sulfatase family protein n=1 Tax=Cellulophaga sp. L1A9 TaxID=2686362 RepID=UPI00131C0A63|nr:arylsulfatase [Cellulophaga sp. L1A9]
MNTIKFSTIIFALLFISCESSKKEQNKSAETIKHPNIVYILADDMGYGDLKSLNPDSKIPTPNMDQVVKNGVHFTDAHTNSAVCTPTRYGVLTGRYAFRTRLKNGVTWGYTPSLIEEGRETVASFMKQNGYQTACIGKWHLGLDWPKKDESKEIKDIQWNENVPKGYEDNVDYSKRVGGGPADHGFDHSLIIPASLDMSPYVYIRDGYVVEQPLEYTEGKEQQDAGRGVFWRPGKVAQSFDFDQVLPSFVDSATQYIADQANQEKPFFLYLPLPAPHTPWLPTEGYQGKSNADTYGDFVVMVDDMIGKVIKQVKDAGVEENTLIIITSDNGSDWRPDDKEKTGHQANYIYKGRKADIYEAGHRVPYIAQWKGVIPAGHQSSQVICTTDLLATMAGLLDKPLVENAGEDSFNLWPAYIGVAEKPIREATIHHSLHGAFAIRKGKWKYTAHLGSGGFSVPEIIEFSEGEALGTLYDMENDPQEKNNLYMKNPKTVQELSQLLEKYKVQGYSRVISE